jgi:hypothetical protein
MKKRIRKSRRRFCWTCFSYTNGELYEVCMIPAAWNGRAGRLELAVCRDVCEWCFIHIHGINQQFSSSDEWRNYWQRYQLGRGLYRNRPFGQRQHSPYKKRQPPHYCFFCGDPTGAKDPLHRRVDIHHIIPRREFADKEKANEISNLSFAHRECHNRFNIEHDQSCYHRTPFTQRWGDKEMGRNIFKQQPAAIAAA